MKLSNTQKHILETAAQRDGGLIEPLPKHIHKGIKPGVINGLLKRALIEQTPAGYAINHKGRQSIDMKPTPPEPSNQNDMPQSSQTPAVSPAKKPTKQACMIALMERPQGASIDEICEETGWQKHTVRGAFAGTLKKRLGLHIESHKNEDNVRCYRIIGNHVTQ